MFVTRSGAFFRWPQKKIKMGYIKRRKAYEAPPMSKIGNCLFYISSGCVALRGDQKTLSEAYGGHFLRSRCLCIPLGEANLENFNSLKSEV